MIRIYSTANPLQNRCVAAFLEQNGLEVIVQGEHRTPLAGAIPPLESWSEVMLVNPAQETDARACVERFIASQKDSGKTWRCPSCGEDLEEQFKECWRCQPRPAPHVPPTTPDVLRLSHLFHLLLFINIVSSIGAYPLAMRTYGALPDEIYAFAVNSYRITAETGRRLDLLYWGALVLQWFGLLLRYGPARQLFAAVWAYTVLANLWQFDFAVFEGLELALGSINCMCGGALLVLCWLTPLKTQFSTAIRRPASASSLTPEIE